MPKCILCESSDIDVFFEKLDPQLGERKYILCNSCRLIFLLPEYFLSIEEERSRYDLHQNSPDDEGYVDFLKRLTGPLMKELKAGMKGLDYGCGPGPAICHIMAKKGFEVKNYDPIYFPDQEALKLQYDFVTVTEVVEHFYLPRNEFIRLSELANDDGGKIAIMTQMWDREERFAKWWYHREHTHVCFYHQDTFKWIAQWLGFDCAFPAPNVAIFTK